MEYFKRKARTGRYDIELPVRSMLSVYMSSFPEDQAEQLPAPGVDSLLADSDSAAESQSSSTADSSTSRNSAEALPADHAAEDARADEANEEQFALQSDALQQAAEPAATLPAAQGDTGTVVLPGRLFNRPVNPFLLYQVVRWQRAKKRAVRALLAAE